VAADSWGNVVISGRTDGSLGAANLGGNDAFLAKYDPAGNLLWTEQLGTSDGEDANSVAVDASGNAFISGTTNGNLGGTHSGAQDAFVARYDPAGNRLWTEQLGTRSEDRSYSVAADGLGNVFISGRTWGNLGGTNAGSWDAFLVKFAAADTCSLASLGDFNCDGEIGLLDLRVLGANWGAIGVIGAEGDANGDCKVGLLDLDILGQNWGRSVPIPEPGTIASLVLVVGIVGCRYRHA